MPKLLADFLQEQQEPFALEAYLLERGCSRRIDNPNCSHFLKGVFSQFMVVANADRKVEGNGVREKVNAAGDGVSAASSGTTLFNSCSHCLLEGEVELINSLSSIA